MIKASPDLNLGFTLDTRSDKELTQSHWSNTRPGLADSRYSFDAQVQESVEGSSGICHMPFVSQHRGIIEVIMSDSGLDFTIKVPLLWCLSVPPPSRNVLLANMAAASVLPVSAHSDSPQATSLSDKDPKQI